MAVLDKRSRRQKRGKATREHIKQLGRERGTHRLVLHKSTTHIYAQVLHPRDGRVLAQASSLELRADPVRKNKTDIAKEVGKTVAKRSQEVGVAQVACDRSGFKYHGRIAALVEAAREAGLQV